MAVEDTSPRPWATELSSHRPLCPTSPEIPPGTLISLVRSAVAAHPDRVQYVLPDGGRTYTTAEFYALGRAVAKALLGLGVAPLDTVCILGANAVEWFAADVGAALAAAIPVGVYPSNKPDAVAYIANHCAARVFFVDAADPRQVRKVLSVRGACPTVRRVVCWGGSRELDVAQLAAEAADGETAPNDDDEDKFVLRWDEFLDLGAAVDDADVDARMDIPQPTSVAKLIYTSGTTGPPKAVMISHDNIFFTTQLVDAVIRPTERDRMVSYLPVSHIAANLTDIAGTLASGGVMALVRPDALRGTLVDTLRAVRPTIVTAVPRVFEKIMEQLLAVGTQAGAVQRAIATWAKGVGAVASAARDAASAAHATQDGGYGADAEAEATAAAMPWGYALANALVFRNVKNALGLDECRLLINTAAPLQRATLDFFSSLDFEIFDMYGMSESTGPLTFNYPARRAGTSGRACMGVEMKVHSPDASGEGELCFRGRSVFVGYMGDEAETRNAIDSDGFLHSGDLGKVDEHGFMTITGRAKELIVTAGGENVAPALVEATLLAAMPAISRAFAVGDRKKFVAALLVPCMDEKGRLAGPAALVNPLVKTAAEAVSDDLWATYMSEGVSRANKDAISNAATVKKVELLERDFSIETGELTPTMKVKRKVVVKNLSNKIGRIYGE